MRFGWIVLGIIFCVLFLPIMVVVPGLDPTIEAYCSIADIVFFVLGIVMIIYGLVSSEEIPLHRTVITQKNVYVNNREKKPSLSISICPYCGKDLDFPKPPKFCPFCKERLTKENEEE